MQTGLHLRHRSAVGLFLRMACLANQLVEGRRKDNPFQSRVEPLLVACMARKCVGHKAVQQLCVPGSRR